MAGSRAARLIHRPSPCLTWLLRCRDDRVIHGSTGSTTTGLLQEQEPIQGVCTVKFRCDRDALSEALQTVQRGVSSRPGIPALTGVLLDGVAEGRLTMTTTDLEVSARLTIDVQVSEPGIALIPARLLADTVKSLSDAPVDVETDQSQARIRCAAYRHSVAPPGTPGLQEPGHSCRGRCRRLRGAVSQVARAASRDEARPVLTGSWSRWSRRLRVGKTDSYRLRARSGGQCGQ